MHEGTDDVGVPVQRPRAGRGGHGRRRRGAAPRAGNPAERGQQGDGDLRPQPGPVRRPGRAHCLRVAPRHRGRPRPRHLPRRRSRPGVAGSEADGHPAVRRGRSHRRRSGRAGPRTTAEAVRGAVACLRPLGAPAGPEVRPRHLRAVGTRRCRRRRRAAGGRTGHQRGRPRRHRCRAAARAHHRARHGRGAGRHGRPLRVLVARRAGRGRRARGGARRTGLGARPDHRARAGPVRRCAVRRGRRQGGLGCAAGPAAAGGCRAEEAGPLAAHGQRRPRRTAREQPVGGATGAGLVAGPAGPGVALALLPAAAPVAAARAVAGVPVGAARRAAGAGPAPRSAALAGPLGPAAASRAAGRPAEVLRVSAARVRRFLSATGMAEPE